MNNALTKFTSYFASKRASKHSAIALGLFAAFSFLGVASANADNAWVTSNGHVVGDTVQFNWQGGTATYTLTVQDGSTVSVTVNNTIANTIGWGAPTPDIWTISINGQQFSGNTVEIKTVSAVVSGQVTITVYGKDVGFWGGWYGPIFSAPVVTLNQDTVSSTAQTQTQASQDTVTASTSTGTAPSESSTVGSTSSNPDSLTATASSTSTPTQESASAVASNPTTSSQVETSVGTVQDSSTLVSDTVSSTVNTETSTPVQNQDTQTPLPTPVPIVETQPIAVPEPQPVVQPAPEPSPTPVEQTVPSVTETPVEDPVIEVPVEEGPSTPVAEEQPPVEEQPESPVEEEQPQNPDETSPEEQNVPTPQPEPEPSVVPEPTSQPDNASQSPVVVLDNGVILPQEVAEQVELLRNPGELLSELFTNPVAAIAALGAVGADMSPEAREKSKKAVVQAVVVGSIVTQAAGAAAYRRKP